MKPFDVLNTIPLSRTKRFVYKILRSKFWWNSNLAHRLRIFRIIILNTEWKDTKCRKNVGTKNFTYSKKCYVNEIAAVNLSKIYFLKNAKKTCKPNSRNLNRDWTNLKQYFISSGKPGENFMLLSCPVRVSEWIYTP